MNDFIFINVQITRPTDLGKPYDIALSAVCQAREAAIAGFKASGNKQVSACFLLGGTYCSVFTTPTGQLRYQVGPCGKPTRTDTHMLRVLTDNEREAQAFKARGERVPMMADVNYCEGHAPIVNLKGRTLLALDNKHGHYRLYFHVGAVPRGSEGRKDYGGPMVPGPWAFACGRAVVLSDSRAHQERDAAEEAAAIVVTDGSLLVIDNCQYRVTVERGEYLTLHLQADFSVDNVNAA